MAKKALPSPEVIRQLLRLDEATGPLFWCERPASLFNATNPKNAAAMANMWNKAHAGKEAFTTICNYGYRYGALRNRSIRAHILVWIIVHGRVPEDDIDHIDGDRLNNRPSNLREATRSQNNQNQRIRVGGSSQFKGVCWHGKKWTAGIFIDGRRRHLGLFSDEQEAARAYDKAAVANWGPFARTNFAD